MSSDQNLRGERGEAIFDSAIRRPVPGRGYLFQPKMLGEKWPTVDFLLQLSDTTDIAAFCFVQVRTTSLGYTSDGSRLRVNVDQESIARLNLYPAPTYVAGVDERNEAVFVASVNQECERAMNGISVRCPLDVGNLLLLWSEVYQYWRQRGGARFESHFVDRQWCANGQSD